jgi:BolA family transcriptional regulator, general stress-responsive regulator
MTAVAESLRHKLIVAFAPTQLDIEDESSRHAGHAGSRPGGESHFHVVIEAAAFEGASRLARQRMVYQALAEELAGPVHALSVRALAPGEPR